MAITSTGPLKFSDLQTEFGGTDPIGLSEYYAGGNFVAPGTAGDTGTIPSSGNSLNIGKFYGAAAAGLVWGSRFLRPGANTAQDSYIRYLNGKFFIMGSTGNPSAITYSTDSTASVWLTTSVGNGLYYGPLGSSAYAINAKVTDIATNGTRYVVAGSSLGTGSTGSFPNGVLATSTDLVNWTVLSSGSLPGSMVNVKRIIWSPERSLFVAVGPGTSNNVFTSPDGITWTARALPGRTDGIVSPNINSVYWNGFAFVVVGQNVIAYSSDGITWTNSNGYGDVGYSYTYNDITFGNNLFVVTSNAAQAVWTSPNGVTWTKRTLPTNVSNTNAIAYGDNKFVILNNNGETTTSVDGITWTYRGYVWTTNGGFSGSGLGGYYDNIIFGASKFIATGTGFVVSSADGLAWASLSSGSVVDLNSVASNGNFTVAVGIPSFNEYSRTRVVPTILKSSDGNIWSQSDTSTLTVAGGFTLNDILWTGTTFVAVGGGVPAYGTSGPFIVTSTDGTIWATQVNTNTGSTIKSVAQIGNTLITNTKLKSTDGGLTWLPDSATYGGDYIAASPNLFVIAYQNNVPGGNLIYYTSPDGINWTQRSFTFTKNVNINRIRWVNDRFIICGSTDTTINYNGSNLQFLKGSLFYSTDPTNPNSWTECSGFNYQTSYYQPYPFTDVCYGFGKYYAVGSNPGAIWSSSDGVTFSEIKSVGNNTLNEYSAKNKGSGFQNLFSIVKSNNKLIAVGDNGVVVTSPTPTSITI